MTIARGEGCNLYTTDGKEYLDFVAGIATCALGHNNAALNAAIAQQMATVHHVSNLYLIPAQAGLATWLTDNSVADKVFFCNSGAEANEAAIKCARRHAANRGITKPIIITAHQSFHGRTLGSLSATGQPKYHKGFGYDGQMVPGFQYVTYNNVDELQAAVKEVQAATDGRGLAAVRYQTTGGMDGWMEALPDLIYFDACKNHSFTSPVSRILFRSFHFIIFGRTYIQIMMEALQGEGGIIPGDPTFFQTVRALCDETGAFMICDEVQIGMGRSGQLWGYENLNIAPDIFTSAKALGGGVPIGAMMARGVAADVFGPGDHASTYGGNPLACAAGLAVAKYMCDHDTLGNVMARGDQLSTGLAAMAKRHGALLGGVRGWGLLKGIEIVAPNVTPGQVVQAAMDEGLLLVGAGSNVVRFVPPLIVTEAEIESALTMLETAVAKVEAKLVVAVEA